MEPLPLIPEQRQRRILELLDAHGVLSIHALTEDLAVSPMTVRRDIANLENNGQVAAVQGGVRLAARAVAQPPHERGQRESLETPHKRAIAERAGRMVGDGMTVFLDAGTTCEAIVPYLRQRSDVTVVTNDPHSALALVKSPALRVILTGGELDATTAAMGGPLAAATVSALNFDLAFISTGAWSAERGVMAPALTNVAVKHAALAATESAVLVADSSKYGAIARFHVTALNRLSAVISDDALERSAVLAVNDTGVELVEVAP